MSTKLGTLTLDLVAKIGNFVEPMKKAGDTTQRESKRIESSINSASKAIVALGATALAGLTVSAVIESADAYTQMAARIRNATKDTAEYDLVQNRLLNTANGTYRALSEAQEVYLGLSGGLKELGYNTNQVLNISDSLSYSFVHNATSVDKAQSAMSAYGKVLDKGKVDADAWFSIMAATPNVLDDVAKASGKSAQEIRKLGAEGKLSVDDLNKGLLQSRDANQALADAMENSLADGLVSVKNGFEVLVGKANMATSATSTLASGLITVGDFLAVASENLDVIAVAGGTAATVLALKMTPAIILSGKSFAISSIESVKYQVALARMAAQAGGTTTALTLLGGAARGALAVLGGPVGLALTVATVAASYVLFRDKTKDSTVSLRENNETVEDAIQKYSKLSEIKRADQLVQEREKLKELTKAQKEADAQLLVYASSMATASDFTTQSQVELGKLFQEYKKTGDLNKFLDLIQKSTLISQRDKDETIKRISALEGASKATTEQSKLIEKLINLNPRLSRTNDEVTNSVNRQKTAYQALTEQQKKVYDSISQDLSRERYIQANVSQGIMSRDKAEFFADKRSDAGVAYNERLSKAMFSQIEASWKLTQNTEKRVEAEKKITEEQKKKADFAEKNYSYSKSDLKILERVSKLNAEHGLNKISAQYGVPDNLVAAIIAQESGGLINAKSPTGAIGPGQTTSIFRKQYGMSVADSYDVKKVAEAISKDLSKSFEVFGNWVDAATAYNAGVGGTKSLNTTGFTTSTSKTKEAKNYAPSVDKFFTGLNGSSLKSSGLTGKEAVLSIKELGEYWESVEDLKQKSLERQKSVSESYLSDEERLNVEHQEKIKAIEEAFAGDDAAIKKYSDLQNIEYQKSLREHQQFLQHKNLDERKQLLEVRKNWMSAEEYASQYYALVREEILKTAEYSPEMKELLIRQANSDQGIAENAGREQVWGDYQNRFGNQNQYQSDVDLLKDALNQKLISEQDYYQKRAELGVAWGEDYLSTTAGALKNVLGEESSYYQAAFAMAKGMAVAKVALNAPETYSNVYNALAGIPYVGPYIAPVVAAGAVAVQLAQASIVGNVSYTAAPGYADGGFTGYGGKYEPAGIVHKGEVVFSQEDVSRWGGVGVVEALRLGKSGYSNGGIVDMNNPKIVNPQTNEAIQNFVSEKQTQQSNPIHLNNINVLDPSIVGDFMGSAPGIKTFMNFIKNNRSQVKAVIG